MTEQVQPTGAAAQLAELAEVDPATELRDAERDILARARWARRHNDGHPNGAWSTGEQLAAAVVLDDTEHLTAMGYTRSEALARVAGGMYFPPVDVDAWLSGLRAQLDGGQ